MNAPEAIAVRNHLSDLHHRLVLMNQTEETRNLALRTAIDQLGHSISNLTVAAERQAYKDAEAEGFSVELDPRNEVVESKEGA